MSYLVDVQRVNGGYVSDTPRWETEFTTDDKASALTQADKLVKRGERVEVWETETDTLIFSA